MVISFRLYLLLIYLYILLKSFPRVFVNLHELDAILDGCFCHNSENILGVIASNFGDGPLGNLLSELIGNQSGHTEICHRSSDSLVVAGTANRRFHLALLHIIGEDIFQIIRVVCVFPGLHRKVIVFSPSGHGINFVNVFLAHDHVGDGCFHIILKAGH